MPQPPSWVDRCLAWRDRLLADPVFRRRAALSFLTRRLARRRARDLFDLCAGFVYSQVLLACVQVRLFDALGTTPRSAAELAPRLGLSVAATQRLLTAAASLRLLAHRRHGRFSLGPLGYALVGNPPVNAVIEHHALVYRDLADPLALLSGGVPATELAAYWPYTHAGAPAALDSAQVAAYTALMAASQPLVAEQVLDAYPIANHRRLLDVGGGDGSFLVAAAARAPRLDLVLFDLPSVAQCATARFAAAGLERRATAIGGDFLVDRLPEGADVASLVRVLHDHDDAAAMAILAAVHRALPNGGTLIVAEPMSGAAGALPVGDAYFGFYLLAMGRGRARTPAALGAMLAGTGFSAVREIATGMPVQTGLIVASR